MVGKEIEEIKSKSTEIITRFKAAGVEISEPEVLGKMTALVTEFKVPVNEAVRTVVSFYRQKHGIKFEDMKGSQGPAGIVKIGDLGLIDNTWISARVKVIQIWEPMNDVIGQTGLVGDETGVVKFTIFAKNMGLGTLEEGKSYDLSNFVTSVWQGQLSIKGNKNSTITEIPDEIQTKRKQEVIMGVITRITAGSGLIKRCPECNRKLTKGACGEHGKVEGLYDLRIKAVMSPFGRSDCIDLIINREITEQLIGLTLDKAKEMATEAMDTTCVIETIEEKVPGRYYEITGQLLPSDNMLVDSIKPVSLFNTEKAKAIMTTLGGV